VPPVLNPFCIPHPKRVEQGFQPRAKAWFPGFSFYEFFSDIGFLIEKNFLFRYKIIFHLFRRNMPEKPQPAEEWK
jgi:hypothetical protein